MLLQITLGKNITLNVWYFFVGFQIFYFFQSCCAFYKKKYDSMSTSTKPKQAAEKKSTKNRWLIIRMKKLLQYRFNIISWNQQDSHCNFNNKGPFQEVIRTVNRLKLHITYITPLWHCVLGTYRSSMSSFFI